MQIEARAIAHDAARAEMGMPPNRYPIEPLGDFGFYYSLAEAMRWYINLERFGYLPDIGHISQQDWRKMADIATFRRLVNEAYPDAREEWKIEQRASSHQRS